MARLSKQNRQELENIRAHLLRAASFVRDERVAICWVSQFPPTNKSDFGSHDGKQALSPLAKDIGSGLTGLYKAITAINELLEIK